MNTKYTRKTETYEAKQWFKLGDIKEVYKWNNFEKENYKCEYCGKNIDIHGGITTIEVHSIVCPGDWIVKKDGKILFVMTDSDFKKSFVRENKNERD